MDRTGEITRSMRLSLISVALLVLLATIGVTFANDALVNQSAGNLQFFKNYSVAIRSERLIIGPPRMPGNNGAVHLIPIHVEYELENVTQAPVEATIGFPLPACNLNQYLWNKHLSYISGSASACVKEPEMKLSIDGKANMAGKWDFVFLLDGKALANTKSEQEIGERARNLIGLIRDPDIKSFVDDPEFTAAAGHLCQILKGRLEHAECSAFPRLQVHRTFIWRNTFVPKRRTEVVHDFVVQASYNVDPEEQFSFDAFCLADPANKAAWQAYKSSNIIRDLGYPDFPRRREFFTEYVLKTGALWATPIERFELVIRKSSADQLLSTCFSGLTKTSPLEFKAHRENFTPGEDLRILYAPTEKNPLIPRRESSGSR